jgi:hypothetical protein
LNSNSKEGQLCNALHGGQEILLNCNYSAYFAYELQVSDIRYLWKKFLSPWMAIESLHGRIHGVFWNKYLVSMTFSDAGIRLGLQFFDSMLEGKAPIM